MSGTKDRRSIDALDDLYREAITAPEFENPLHKEMVEEDFLSGEVFTADGAGDGSFGQIVLRSLAEQEPGWHGKEVIVAADKMRVTVKIRGGKELSAYQLKHGLEQLGITHGIIWKALTTVERQSRAGVGGEFVVAVGEPAEPRVRVEFFGVQRTAALDGAIGWVADGVKLDSQGVWEKFNTDRFEQIDANSLIVKAVKAGEVLATVHRNDSAKPGINVMGEVVEPSDDLVPVAGDYVQYDETRGTYTAQFYGYLACRENAISIQPPVWFSPDYLGAYFVNCSHVGAPLYPSAGELLQILSHFSVTERAIRRGIIEKLTDRLGRGQHLSVKTVKIAEAVAAKPGCDAHYRFAVDMGEHPEVIGSDGAIDLTGRRAVVRVSAGDLIAEKITATKGEQGCDLLGRVIEAADGLDQQVPFAKVFRIEDSEGRIRYYAGKEGNLRFVNGELAIADLQTISGNIDSNTGNIDRQEDLLINGSVMAGFSVRSQGNVAIAGSVYNGAKVVAGGDISIGEGVVGAEAKVVALGNLRVVYVQEAEVIVKGNALVRGYLFNAVVRANGRIVVVNDNRHGPRSGRIIGGLTCSSKEIVVSRVGHVGQPDTVLAILPDPEYSGQIKRLEEEGRTCRESIARISRSLPFEHFDAAAIKKALSQMPPEQREPMVKLLGVFNNLIKRQQNIETLRKEIHGKILGGLRAGSITITHEICQGSEIQFGDKKLVLAADSPGMTYSLQGGEIV